MNQKHFFFECPYCGVRSHVTVPSTRGWGDARCEHAVGVRDIDIINQLASKPVIVFATQITEAVDGTACVEIPTQETFTPIEEDIFA